MGSARSAYNDASRRISQVKIKRHCLSSVKNIKEKLRNEPNFTTDYGYFFRDDLLEAPNSICPPAMTRPQAEHSIRDRFWKHPRTPNCTSARHSRLWQKKIRSANISGCL